ncbi:MAG: NAD(P)-dependent oxidoreductase, partial [Cyanobacteria bacterium]|nr:NAD(P)-dependent oxidoreductase [Cyanobacteriota bacterium]
MALRLQTAGYGVVAYNRTAAKLAPLAAAGIPRAETVPVLLDTTHCTVLMLSDATAIAATLLTDTVRPHLSGQTLIQMGTIAPQQSRDLAQQCQAAGATYLEAPVLGSMPQVKDGSLIVMVGASEADYDQWSPVLRCLGEPRHLGPVGAAAATKLAMNQLIGSLTTAFAMSLGLIRREGIAVDAFMDIVRASALYAPTFDKKLTRMVERNFADPNFPTKHLLKDMRLFSEAAIAAGLSPELADTVALFA